MVKFATMASQNKKAMGSIFSLPMARLVYFMSVSPQAMGRLVRKKIIKAKPSLKTAFSAHHF
jgi:hypothetical protein